MCNHKYFEVCLLYNNSFLRMHRATCMRIGKSKYTEYIKVTSEMVKMVIKTVIVDYLEATLMRCIEHPFAFYSKKDNGWSTYL